MFTSTDKVILYVTLYRHIPVTIVCVYRADIRASHNCLLAADRVVTHGYVARDSIPYIRFTLSTVQIYTLRKLLTQSSTYTVIIIIVPKYGNVCITECCF